MRNRYWMSAAAAIVLGASGSHANAITVTFDFNGVAISGTHSNGLGKTGGDSAVETYMNGVFTGAGLATTTVDATGTLATATYNGEAHVNGETLGTSDNGVHHLAYPNAPDKFIMNDDFGINGSATDRFSFSFTDFYVYSIAFDWEIFPDASCPASSSMLSCAHNTSNPNYPDIELLADGSNVWSALATTPVSPAVHLDPQALGHLSTLALNGATTLTFVDWPAEIGIDNLVITGCNFESITCTRDLPPPPTVPEPGTLFLLGASAFAGWRSVRRRMSVAR